jgi:hypothetical protein
MYRSFVDLVFIVLCALAVVLTESVSLRGLKTDPVDVGAEGAARLPLDQMGMIVVGEGHLAIDGDRFDRLEDALGAIAADKAVVVVPESDTVSHHRIVAVWWDIHRTGRHVELGVRAAGAKERT